MIYLDGSVKRASAQTRESHPSSNFDSPGDSEGIVKSIVFSRDTDNAGSKQLDQTVNTFGDRAIPPPYNPLLWATLMEKSTRLKSCVEAMADNTVGLGWQIVPIEPVTETTPQEVKDAIAAETALLKPIFERPNSDMPFTELCRFMKIDEESTGMGYIEAVEDGSGRPTEFYHVPSHTIRVDRRGGFVQVRNGKRVYFADFDDLEQDKHYETGEFYPRGTLDPKARANPLIQFRIYCARDSFYGIPRVVSAAPSVTGNRLAAVRNCSFFENDAVPRMAVLISNGHLSPQSSKDIKEFLRSDSKGPANAHRVMVVEAEGKKVLGMGKSDPVKIELKPLTVGETDDASFQKFRSMNDEEIRECFRIAACFLGTVDDSNKASATAAKKITIDQVFIPEQIRKEFVINHKILPRYGVKHVKFEFLRPKSTDPTDTAQADSVAGRYGGITPNDMRRDRGLKPYPEAESWWAEKPFDLARIAFQAKLMDKPAEGPHALTEKLVDLKGQATARAKKQLLLDDDDSEIQV